VTGFYFFRVFYYCFIQLQSDESVTFSFGALIQCFDLLYLGGLLFFYRARPWPAFFFFGLEDNQLAQVKYLLLTSNTRV
jgi:uncharacterized membrane protein